VVDHLLVYLSWKREIVYVGKIGTHAISVGVVVKPVSMPQLVTGEAKPTYVA